MDVYEIMKRMKEVNVPNERNLQYMVMIGIAAQRQTKSNPGSKASISDSLVPMNLIDSYTLTKILALHEDLLK